MGDLVEDVEESDDFVAFVGCGVAKENLEGSTHTVGLHLAEETALLALDAVQDVGYVVDVLLVLVNLGVISREEPQTLLLLLTQVVPVQLAEKFREKLPRLQVRGDVVGLDGEVATQVASRLLDRLRQNAVDEEEVLDAFRVLKDPPFVLRVVEVELCMSLCPQVRPDGLFRGGVLVKSGEMRGYTGVESADDIVEDLFVTAEFFEGTALKAVFAVDEMPNRSTVVAGEALDVAVDVEVLTLVVDLVLHVPNPPRLRNCPPFCAPQVLSLQVRADAVSVGPRQWDIAFVAAADRAAIGLADAVEDAERALLVDVEADHAEVLGLDELLENGGSRHVHLLHGVLLAPLHQQVVPHHVRNHPQNDPDSHGQQQYVHPAAALLLKHHKS